MFQAIKKLYEEHGSNPTYWIAYSGGLDSHVLLHLMVNLRSLSPIKLKAIHINHSLSPNADTWSAHCEKICKALDVELLQKTISINPTQGDSLENRARDLRYGIFNELLSENDLLLTAHHKDDQAETVLLQLFRGAGPKGLAAMSSSKKFGKGFLLRPLLHFSRQELEAYAEQNHLSWIEDESNFNTDFARNFIRHDIITILKKRWPNIENILERVAVNCAEAQDLLDDLAREDLDKVVGSNKFTVSVSQLSLLTPKRQRLVLRFWLNQLNFAIPSAVKLEQIQQQMLCAREDKNPHIQWQNIELRRYQDFLYVMPRLLSHDATKQFHWNFSAPLKIPNIGYLHVEKVKGRGLRSNINAVSVRFRQGGEYCQLPGRHCHHDLKKLFQTWHVPTWERDRIPLIYHEEKLIAVVGFFLDAAYAVKENEEGYELSLSVMSASF